MQQTAQWWEIAAVVVSALALVGTGFGVWFSKGANRTAEESKRVTGEANTIAREANDIARRFPLVHAVADKQDLHSKLPGILPFEVLPGHVLDIPVPMKHFSKSLAINTKRPDGPFTVRLFQPTGQFFESFAQPVVPFLEGEPPVWVRFHKEPPPQASDAVEQPETPLG